MLPTLEFFFGTLKDFRFFFLENWRVAIQKTLNFFLIKKKPWWVAPI
jgi:hypothetical protein